MNRNKLRTVLALLLALATVFAFAACGGDKDSDDDGGSGKKSSGAKKNQVVHVGETVQYGDFKITFLGTKGPFSWDSYGNTYKSIYIELYIENNGNSAHRIGANHFGIYCDGMANTVDYSVGYGYPDESTGYTNYLDELNNDLDAGRSCDGWVGAAVPDTTKKVEFDYSYSDFSEEWGKVTFVVDL